MVLIAVESFARIALTQVGDALADGQEGFIHCASCDRLFGGSVESMASVPESEDKEVGDFFFLSFDVAEGRMNFMLEAEACPRAEDLVFFGPGLRSSGFGGDFESSAEISLELASGGRWSSFHGVGCGYSCSK